MHHGGQEILIKDALVFLFAAGIVVPLLRLGKIPAVAGFVLAGAALGPNGLGALADQWSVLSFFAV
ncbi:MAG: portal protein, partial [Pseudomonadota bacterium]